MYAITAPHHAGPDGFSPVHPDGMPAIDPAGFPVGAPSPRPGLRPSLVSWAANTVAWVGFVVATVLLVIAFARALAGEPADAYGVAALAVFGVAVLATIGACVGLAVSWIARIKEGELRRPGPVADLVVLSSVTLFTVLTACYPLVFVVMAW
ncbi:hypothetical protein [Gordonia sp. 'Campus']|uniref:hypothetical protein n=1 Tax=Gordonia sp. 'Campus' TaxID=2915824 RepID=UPI001EE410A5|nr:hypothetical protein [Gordonia sp. 'Campus']